MDELIGEGIMEIEPRKAIEHLKSMRDETLLLQKRLVRLRGLQSQPAAQQDERSVPMGLTSEEREELRKVLDQHAGLHAELGGMLSAVELQWVATPDGVRLPPPEREAGGAHDRYRHQLEAVLSEMVVKGASPDAVGRVRAVVESMLGGLQQ